MNWIHCNICGHRPFPGLDLAITNCGHVICRRCFDKSGPSIDPESAEFCPFCNTPNVNVVRLAETGPEVRQFFKDNVADDIQTLQQSIKFQAEQYMCLITNLIKRVGELEGTNRDLRAKVEELREANERRHYKTLEDMVRELEAKNQRAGRREILGSGGGAAGDKSESVLAGGGGMRPGMVVMPSNCIISPPVSRHDETTSSNSAARTTQKKSLMQYRKPTSYNYKVSRRSNGQSAIMITSTPMNVRTGSSHNQRLQAKVAGWLRNL